MKQLYTSNYARNGGNPMAMSISAILPSYYPHIGWFKELAPSKELLYKILDGRVTQAEYDAEYKEYLATLDPVDIVSKLAEGTILLCYEKPFDHCHRHLVRDWLNNSGAAKVSELYNEKEMRILGLDALPMSDLFEY